MSRRLTRASGLIEDVCEHGVGHPNREWLRAHPEHDGIHGCDGCCSEETNMNENAKRTPRPWFRLRILGKNDKPTEPPIYAVVGNERPSDNTGKGDRIVDPICDNCGEADSLPIEAAPDLLAALRAMLDTHGTHGPCQDHDCRSCEKAYDMAHNAVAKAEGD
jgi:hypothetical protein